MDRAYFDERDQLNRRIEMKKIIVLMGILLSMSAMAQSRPVIVDSSKLNCDGTFNITNPVKNIRFFISHHTDTFGSEVLEGLELVGETSCTSALLNQIIQDSSLSFGFVSGKIKVERLADASTKVTVLLFAGPDTLEFSGIK